MNKIYKFTVRHDNGRAAISTTARDEATARAKICAAEGCPDCALTLRGAYLPTLTIYDIKRLTADTSPKYFDRKTLQFFGQRLRDFSVRKDIDRYYISAPIRHDGKPCGRSERWFNPENNKLERK